MFLGAEHTSLMTVFLKLPLSIVKGTHLPSLQPTRDAMEMERVIADAPSYGTFFAGG